MKIHLSYRERIAGLFTLFTFLSVILFTIGVAVQNRWLEKRVAFYTIVSRGDGLRNGSPVLLSGFEVGEVGELDILPNNRIRVELLVREQHAQRIKKGTTAEIRRLLGIGEKRIQFLSDGNTEEQSVMPPGAFIPANELLDLLDAISAVDIGRYMDTMDRAVSALELTLSKLEEENRLERMMEAFDQMGPTMERMNNMLVKIDKPLAELLNDPNMKSTLAGASKILNNPNTRRMLRSISRTMEAERKSEFMEHMSITLAKMDLILAQDSDFNRAMEGADSLFHDSRIDRVLSSIEKLTNEQKIEKLVDNLSSLTADMAKIGPEIPDMSRQLITTMKEAVVVLKALQKTWLLNDESDAVRIEMKKKKRSDD